MKLISRANILWPAWAGLAVGLLMTAFAVMAVREDSQKDAQTELEHISDQAALKIIERLQSYRQILRAGAGLFEVSSDITRQQWRSFVEKLNPSQNLPEVQGVGFAKVIPADELERHTALIRAEGFSEYAVNPVGNRNLYTSIIYLEPFTGRNLRAFGYDMFSEPVRREAMERAR